MRYIKGLSKVFSGLIKDLKAEINDMLIFIFRCLLQLKNTNRHSKLRNYFDNLIMEFIVNIWMEILGISIY